MAMTNQVRKVRKMRKMRLKGGRKGETGGEKVTESVRESDREVGIKKKKKKRGTVPNSPNMGEGAIRTKIAHTSTMEPMSVANSFVKGWSNDVSPCKLSALCTYRK